MLAVAQAEAAAVVACGRLLEADAWAGSASSRGRLEAPWLLTLLLTRFQGQEAAEVAVPQCRRRPHRRRPYLLTATRAQAQ